MRRRFLYTTVYWVLPSFGKPNISPCLSFCRCFLTPFSGFTFPPLRSCTAGGLTLLRTFGIPCGRYAKRTGRILTISLHLQYADFPPTLWIFRPNSPSLSSPLLSSPSFVLFLLWRLSFAFSSRRSISRLSFLFASCTDFRVFFFVEHLSSWTFGAYLSLLVMQNFPERLSLPPSVLECPVYE